MLLSSAARRLAGVSGAALLRPRAATTQPRAFGGAPAFSSKAAASGGGDGGDGGETVVRRGSLKVVPVRLNTIANNPVRRGRRSASGAGLGPDAARQRGAGTRVRSRATTAAFASGSRAGKRPYTGCFPSVVSRTSLRAPWSRSI